MLLLLLCVCVQGFAQQLGDSVTGLGWLSLMPPSGTLRKGPRHEVGGREASSGRDLGPANSLYPVFVP